MTSRQKRIYFASVIFFFSLTTENAFSVQLISALELSETEQSEEWFLGSAVVYGVSSQM